jgi:hypothetical protein
LVTDATLQLSAVDGVPRDAIVAVHNPEPAFTERLAGQVMLGFWLSDTVTLKVHWAVAPSASVATKVLVVTPRGKELPLAKPVVRTVLTPGQLSVSEGVT